MYEAINSFHECFEKKFVKGAQFAQCGNYGKLVTLISGKNFVKSTFLLELI